MQEQTLVIPKTVRYFTLGELNQSSKLLIVLHGYGQSAFFFLKKFEFLISKGYFIVAPEGMHRFYLEGTSGRVGASWMTKEARQDDIRDNFNYLEGLLNHFIGIKDNLTIDILGFSQGAATATRWYEKSRFNIRSLVLWASVFPEDVTMDFSINTTTTCYFVLGDNDPYFDSQSEQRCLQTYESLRFNIIRFDGKHEMNQLVLDTIY